MWRFRKLYYRQARRYQYSWLQSKKNELQQPIAGALRKCAEGTEF